MILRSIAAGSVALSAALACTQKPDSPLPNGATSVFMITLTAPTPASLPACKSALAGTTAFVQSPPTLYTCNGSSWVAIPCNNGLAGSVAYASATQSLYACSAGAWVPIPTGTGATGPAGPQGAPGSLVKITPEPAGSRCASGGQRIDAGADKNKNGALDTGEIQSTQYVCNGSDGATGAPGANGAPGASAIVTSTPEPVGASCANGGVKLSFGMDSNADRLLDPGEVTSVSYVCNGATGSAGQNGETSLANPEPEPPGSNCTTGGVKLSFGLDMNGDGALGADEVTATSYVCNGADGADGMSGGSSCMPSSPEDDPDVAGDENCDDFEGDAAHGVFVAVDGNDANRGTRSAPKQTIGAAVAQAGASSGAFFDVYVSAGTYPERVVLRNGISLFGGYDPTAWTRSGATTTIQSTSSSGGFVEALEGTDLIARTTVSGFTIAATLTSNVSASVYSVYCLRCSGLVLRNNHIQSSTAGAGENGGTGAPGNAGDSGWPGTPVACAMTTPGPGGNGQVAYCAGASGRGGTGGNPLASGVGQSGLTGTFLAGSASPGGGGFGGPAPGGRGGDGTPGANGTAGVNGPSGSGGALASNRWISLPGGSGASGQAGGPGGGGGGSGGQNCTGLPSSCLTRAGNGGGGGGAPGCAGQGGLAGQGGGGSFGVFLVSSPGVTLVGNTIASGAGGRGGNGGAGGPGGIGGSGGPGGNGCSDINPAGNGGNGGNGGPGGHGGGGAGGPSFAVYASATFDPAAQSAIAAVNTLSAASGGSGGPSLGNPGADGAAGLTGGN